jgi:hypothetical protein
MQNDNNNPTTNPLANLIRQHNAIHLAYLDQGTNPPTLHIFTNGTLPEAEIRIPPQLAHCQKRYHHTEAIRPLIAYNPTTCYSNPHQTCQDEPIQLGCQIQPAGANWVGTAGAPVRWKDETGRNHWGILSNAHVMAIPNPTPQRPQHQPTTRYPKIAHLTDYTPVHPTQENYCDAAVADALIDGKHTIDDRILGIGYPTQQPIEATPGLVVLKSGRTTGVTTGQCTATGAAVKVSYEDFTATFIDQDVFKPLDDQFSAPGDSGSLILCKAAKRPCALLFAGNAQLTIANPIRHVIKALNIKFPFIP